MRCVDIRFLLTRVRAFSNKLWFVGRLALHGFLAVTRADKQITLKGHMWTLSLATANRRVIREGNSQGSSRWLGVVAASFGSLFRNDLKHNGALIFLWFFRFEDTLVAGVQQ